MKTFFITLFSVHEQSRPDRDDHVDVLLQNVAEGQADQFEIKKNVDIANTGFDSRSRCLSFFPPHIVTRPLKEAFLASIIVILNYFSPELPFSRGEIDIS